MLSQLFSQMRYVFRQTKKHKGQFIQMVNNSIQWFPG
ncbi:ribosome biogenesis GTPase YlqF, partial [Vibrio vulnificus]